MRNEIEDTYKWLTQLAKQIDAVPINSEVFISPKDYEQHIKSGQCDNFFDRQTTADYGFIGMIYARKLIVQNLN